MMFVGRDTNFHYWMPAFLYAALIFFLSHQSDPPGAQVVPDYTAHFFEYAFFGLTPDLGSDFGIPPTSNLKECCYSGYDRRPVCDRRRVSSILRSRSSGIGR